MIDLEKESLLPLREVPRVLPARPSGKRLHISAVYRWVQRGVSGAKLETVRVGGSTYTSREALQRFAQRSSGRPLPSTHNAGTSRARELDRMNAAIAKMLKLDGASHS